MQKDNPDKENIHEYNYKQKHINVKNYKESKDIKSYKTKHGR